MAHFDRISNEPIQNNPEYDDDEDEDFLLQIEFHTVIHASGKKSYSPSKRGNFEKIKGTPPQTTAQQKSD